MIKIQNIYFSKKIRKAIMKLSIIGLILLPLFAFTSMHKFYVSVSQINYIENKQSVQIISRVFIDDMENVLRSRYGEDIILAGENEPEETDVYLEKYLKERFEIKINGENQLIVFIGKEYDGDIMRCYLEIENINSIKTFEISNKVLFDLFEDQQNIVKTKIYSNQKSVILTKQSHSAMLKFN
ncbi:DUF6702 family protein [Aestuariivivens marinum]|uniref:DUF6702 family protein n=2 Tax=Aestuariivivens marinum TaxID=2913555 RepID=UPI001F57DCA4|nr:DUF6702 family protein [Aestuariivivens marinum]